MILNEKGRESETVTKPWGASLEFAGKRGPWASSSGVLGSDSGEGAGREGEVVNYTSIPSDAPEPQRYLFCHGDGTGWRSRTLHGGGGGGGRKRFCGMFSLAKIWTEERGGPGRPAGQGQAAPWLSALCGPSSLRQPQVAPATHKQNYNTRKNNSCPSGKKEDQFITQYIIQPK